jgi:hypothetical protein
MLTPEQEEYRKQQRQEAEEQLAQMEGRQEQAKAGVDATNVNNINFQVPGANNTNIAVPEDPEEGNKDINDLKKKLRAQYANDNEGYKQALAREGIDSEVPETNGVQSIMQAYYSGKIDKNTRDYMMADAIAKFARNTGRDIGNIGAQFTGGAINNNYETSEWDKRNSALAGNETTARLAEQEGSEANLKRQSDLESLKQQKLNTEKGDKALEASRVMEGYKNDAKKKADEYRAKEENAKADIFDGIAGEYALLTSASTSDVGTEEHIGNAVASIAKAVKSGLISEDEASGMLSPIISMMGKGGTNISLGGINLNNSSNSDSNTGTPIDNPTANDQQEGLHLDTGVSDDIRDVYSKITDPSVSPSKKGEIIRDLYQGAGTKADKFKLAFLVENNLIDPNESYNGASGKDILKRVENWSNDKEFLNDYKHYTNSDFSNAEAIQNIKSERAAQEEANRQAVRGNALKKAGLPQDATPEQIKAKIEELDKRPGSTINPVIINQIKSLESLL